MKQEDHKMRKIAENRIIPLVLTLFSLLFIISCGGPISSISENGGIFIKHNISSTIDSSKYHRVFFAGFAAQSKNTFDIVEISNDTFNRELSKNSPFLIIFEKPFEITKNSITGQDKKINLVTENVWEDPGLWKNIAGIYKADLVIGGEISFTTNNRTTIEKKTTFKDGKESVISKVTELKFFKVDVLIHFINGSDGKTIYTKTVSKDKGYELATEESKNIFLSILKETVPEIRSVLITEQEPVRRILLE